MHSQFCFIFKENKLKNVLSFLPGRTLHLVGMDIKRKPAIILVETLEEQY